MSCHFDFSVTDQLGGPICQTQMFKIYSINLNLLNLLKVLLLLARHKTSHLRVLKNKKIVEVCHFVLAKEVLIHRGRKRTLLKSPNKS